MNKRRLRLLALLGTTLATIAVSGTATPVSATADHHHHDEPASKVVATGLDNPRLLSFDRRGRLFVAESGTGGSGPCFEGPEGEACFGKSGGISLVGHHGARRVASGFPSVADREGNGAGGPTDIWVGPRGRYVVSIGLGGDPADRADLPRAGRFLGTLTQGRLGSRHRHVLADLGRYESRRDPDGAGPDSNPVGFIRWGRGFAAVDAGGNDLLKVTRRGRISTLAVFDTREVPNPFGGPDVDMQAVPTSVIAGPRRSLFVSELTGFPFPPGEARIYKVRPGHAPQVYVTGLTNVTDLAWHRGHLYVVQIADEGLLAAGDGLPMGSLVRIERDGSKETVVDNLPAPYGVAVKGNSAYVTTCSVCAGGGEVLKVSLAH